MCFSLFLFLRRFVGGFARASELLESESLLWAIGSVGYCVCGLLDLWALSCQKLKCCPLCCLSDAGLVLVCSLGAGPQSELLLPY